MKFRTDFKHVKRRVSMKYLLSFQFCLTFGHLVILSPRFKHFKGAVTAVCFCLVATKCFAKVSLKEDQVSYCDFNFICCSI